MILISYGDQPHSPDHCALYQGKPHPGPCLSSEQVDAQTQLIADSHPEWCVTWVCEEHHSHCVNLGTDHDLHECIWCQMKRLSRSKIECENPHCDMACHEA